MGKHQIYKQAVDFRLCVNPALNEATFEQPDPNIIKFFINQSFCERHDEPLLLLSCLHFLQIFSNKRCY